MAQFFSQSTLWTLDAQQVPYDFYTCRQFFDWDCGRAQMPVAAAVLPGIAGEGAPGQASLRTPSEIIQTVAPFGRRIVQWAVQRFGGLPKVPHPDPDDTNQILADAMMAMDCPPLQEDGANHVYRLGATYIYFLQKPYWLLDNLGMGATPYDITPASSNVFNAAFFTSGLQGTIPIGGIG